MKRRKKGPKKISLELKIKVDKNLPPGFGISQ